MIYQSNTGKLYLLLSACAPQNKQIQDRLFQEEMRQSKEVDRLKHDPQGKELLEAVFHGEVDEHSPAAKRERQKKCISLITRLLAALSDALQHRDVSLLTPDDKPDILSPTSIKRTLHTIEQLPDKQAYTNISIDESLRLFEPGLIKDAKTVLPNLTPSQLEHAEQYLATLLNGQKYCISPAVLEQQVMEMRELLDESTVHLIKARQLRHRRRVWKGIMLVFVMALTVGLALLHVLPAVESTVFGMVSAGLTVLIMIAG